LLVVRERPIGCVSGDTCGGKPVYQKETSDMKDKVEGDIIIEYYQEKNVWMVKKSSSTGQNRCTCTVMCFAKCVYDYALY
jgi:hypothetical protein